MPKCLVFGGDGFIGASLARRLVASGHDVTIFGRNKSNQRSSNPSTRYIEGEFLSKSDISNAVEGQDYVFHFTTLTNPAVSENDPYIDIETNVKMTIHVLEACVENQVKKIIFPSSGGAIYGDNPKGYYNEDDVTMPISPYAIGKQTIEGYIRFFSHKYKLDYLILRISNVYGEGQRSIKKNHGVIPIFINNMLHGQPIYILGDGSMTRDYIYVEDLSKVIDTISFKTTKHKTYNIGSGIGVSVNELIAELEEISGISAKKCYTKSPTSYVRKAVLDTTRIEREFGVIPKILLKDGLRKVYTSMNSNN